MTTLREAAQKALDAFDSMIGRKPERVETAITALRTALASQIVTSDCSDSHQPDAWRTEARNEHGLPVFFCASEVKQAGVGLIPLYTAPPQRQPLTGVEIAKLLTESAGIEIKINDGDLDFARLIERAHGIGGEE